MTLKTAHDLITGRMHFPARPALREAEQADDAAFVEIVMMALVVSVVPVHAGELRLGDGRSADAEMNWEVVKRLAPSHSAPITNALSLLPSGSRK